jgi:hypothetical protein
LRAGEMHATSPKWLTLKKVDSFYGLQKGDHTKKASDDLNKYKKNENEIK